LAKAIRFSRRSHPRSPAGRIGRRGFPALRRR
jgi:hypothetical protein